MIFKLHYWCLAAGANALGLLLGVYIQEYTNANAFEIGLLYMVMPVSGVIFRPIICSMADRKRAHQKCLIICLLIVAVSYVPFIVIPLLGPEIYHGYPRVCWYVLVLVKVLGDVAFGGAVSIADALAINYAKRIGTSFTVYRVWGTISWMVFGLIIGQINEVPFLPKYIPGFMILILSSLLDMFVIWLWPNEYFRLIPESPESEIPKHLNENEKSPEKEEYAITKSLLPRQLVWAHAKRKLASLVTCSCFNPDYYLDIENDINEYLNKSKDLDSSPNDSKQKYSKGTIGLFRTMSKGSVGNVSDCANFKDLMSYKPPQHDNQSAKQVEAVSNDNASIKTKANLNKMTQVRVLFLLLRRDPRIALYLLFFIGAGSVLAPMGFLFMSFAKRCHDDDSCDFSLLCGFLQAAMSIYETITFLFSDWIQGKIGRVSTGSIAFLLMAAKMIFYGTVYSGLNPYWALVFEGFRGTAYAIFVTLMVELGHKFSNEVQYIIPELIEKDLVSKDIDKQDLKIALSSTMQSLFGNANDGIGRAVGSLLCGLILQYNPDYENLWLILACTSLAIFTIITVINLADYLFHFNLGLDEGYKKKQCSDGELDRNSQLAVVA